MLAAKSSMVRFLVIATVILSAFEIGHSQEKKPRVLFFGDSITELGVRPDGYISQLEGLIRSDGKADRFELIGAGVSGNKIYDLYLRVDEDVLAKKPNIVVIYIGVNDIWHKGLLGTGTDFDKFGKFYTALVDKLISAKIRVIVCTPAVIGERRDFSNQFDGDLNLYSGWIREFAAKGGLPLVDLRRAFLDRESRDNVDNKASGILTTDRVHLNQNGNRLVAEEIWKILQKQ